jgi:hypothetical protein
VSDRIGKSRGRTEGRGEGSGKEWFDDLCSDCGRQVEVICFAFMLHGGLEDASYLHAE